MEQAEHCNHSLLLTEWQELIQQTSPKVHDVLAALSDDDIHHLVNIFYDYMILHSETVQFLNSEQVNTRLSHSMFYWLRSVPGSAKEDLSQLLEKQREIGIVHARIGVPIDLVTRGSAEAKNSALSLVAKKSAHSGCLIKRNPLF